MLRRSTLLAVLLLALSVLAPAVLACEASGNCCPNDSSPCGSQPIIQPACCVEQPAQALSTVAAREHDSQDLRLPGGPAPAASTPPRSHHASFVPPLPPSGTPTDQQLLYLRTGRLRL